MCRAIGRAGAALIPDGGGVLTHCNTGGLATAEYGTALARPVHRGASRANASGLRRRDAAAAAGRPADRLGAAAARHRRHADLRQHGRPGDEGRHGSSWSIVGADRIAANGDTANKIGTYGVAVLAEAHGIPFYVAAPSSTFDLTLPNGDGIPIEQRDPREVTHGFGKQTAPDGVARLQSGFRRDAARTDRGDHHGKGRDSAGERGVGATSAVRLMSKRKTHKPLFPGARPYSRERDFSDCLLETPAPFLCKK